MSFFLTLIFLLQSSAFAQTTSNTVFDQLIGSSTPDNIDDLITKLQDKQKDPNAPVFTRISSLPGSKGNNSKILPGSPADKETSKASVGAPSKSTSVDNDFGATISNQVSLARFPFSRSLQGAFSSLDEPRKIFSVKVRDSDDPASFVGYSPMSKQAEVISWNPTAGRYEFKIIEGLDKGGKPVYKNAERSLCIKCHQNEGPIFPKFPWSESDFNPKLFKRMASDESDKIRSGNLFGIDADVRQANSKMQERKICQELCAEGDLRCKKALIAGALMENKRRHPAQIKFVGQDLNSSTQFDEDKVDDITGKGGFGTGFGSNFERFIPDSRIQDIVTSSFKGRDFAYPSSIIPDRSVDLNDPTQSRTVVAKVDDLEATKRELASGINASDPNFRPTAKNAAELDSIKGFITYSEEFATSDLRNQAGTTGIVYNGVRFDQPSSPAFVRPRIGQMTAIDIAKNLPSIGAACIFPPKLMEKYKSANFAQIEAALFSDEADALVKGKIDWEKLDDLVAITRAPANTAKADCNFGPPQDLSALRAVTIALQKVVDKNMVFTGVQREQVHTLLQKYCSECHDKGKAMDLGIDFKLLDSFKSYKTTEKTPLYYKLRTEMPPEGEPAPTDEERKLIINVLSH